MDTAHQCFVKQGPVSNWAASTEGIWITMEHAPVPRAILDNAVKWNLTVNDLRNRKLFLCLYRPMLTCVNKTRFICIPQTKSRVCTRWLFLVGVYRPLLQILNLFRTKNAIFTPVFRPPWAEIMSSLLRLEHQRNLKIHFKFAYHPFFPIHFELKR